MSTYMFRRRRSPLVNVFDTGATWSQELDIVESLSGELESPTAGICDLSALPRSGAKGSFDNAPSPNTYKIDDTGGLYCRLSEDEVLILSSPNGRLSKVPETSRVHIPRQDSHCQIGISGRHATGVLSRLCAVESPKENVILQTRVAEVSAIVINESRAKDGAYYILSESTYAQHIWDSLHKAAKQEGGGVIGWRQWRGLFPDI